jgi:hypothetical protein
LSGLKVAETVTAENAGEKMEKTVNPSSNCGRNKKTVSLDEVGSKLLALFDSIYVHNGYGSLEVNVRILKRGQKEILLRCGREYRFVVDYADTPESSNSSKN